MNNRIGVFGQVKMNLFTTRLYNSLGRVVEETLKIGASGGVLATSYDYSGARLAALTYPNGRKIYYDHHATGAVRRVSDFSDLSSPTARYDYIGGRVLTRRLGNGAMLDMRDGSGGTLYDGLGRPLGWSHFDDSLSSRPLLVGFEHGYAAAGNKLFQKSLHDDRLPTAWHVWDMMPQQTGQELNRAYKPGSLCLQGTNMDN
jgi:hypothetical protein